MIKSWSMSDGLPHLSVTSLAQTSDGYLWVGTLAGLARFEGTSFSVFTPQNCPELPKSRIGRLFAGPNNTLFITTERGGGLVVFRGGRFEQLLGSGNEQDEIIARLPESSGDLLFAARSGALWRWSGERLAAISSNRRRPCPQSRERGSISGKRASCWFPEPRLSCPRLEKLPRPPPRSVVMKSVLFGPAKRRPIRLLAILRREHQLVPRTAPARQPPRGSRRSVSAREHHGKVRQAIGHQPALIHSGGMPLSRSEMAPL